MPRLRRTLNNSSQMIDTLNLLNEMGIAAEGWRVRDKRGNSHGFITESGVITRTSPGVKMYRKWTFDVENRHFKLMFPLMEKINA